MGGHVESPPPLKILYESLTSPAELIANVFRLCHYSYLVVLMTFAAGPLSCDQHASSPVARGSLLHGDSVALPTVVRRGGLLTGRWEPGDTGSVVLGPGDTGGVVLGPGDTGSVVLGTLPQAVCNNHNIILTLVNIATSPDLHIIFASPQTIV